ncbi:MAG TPA: DUF4870 domain-containing protein [Candidatus Gracilibacteria bacterium]|nr:DUF4870 domain-containing protein [Candidatus Gracilibacteria bacterium]
MNPIAPEINAQFQQENGMTVLEAFDHVTQWIKEANFSAAEAGIAELKKFVNEMPEIAQLEEQIRLQKSSKIEEKTQTSTSQITERSSNLAEVSRKEKFISALGYMGYFCVLPLALQPNSEFCQYHGRQALAMQLMMFIITYLISAVPGGRIVFWVHLGLAIFAAMKAYRGQLWNIPLIGDISRRLPLDD